MNRIKLPQKKTVKHLTLLRDPRTITSREFNALSQVERLEMVRATQGRRKLDLLVEASDAAELVPLLPAQDLFLLVKEFGQDDVAELIQMSSSDQLATFFDLDCWTGDSLDPVLARAWLFPLIEGDEDSLLLVVQDLDFELLVLILKKFCVVVHGPEVYFDEDARHEAVAKDGGYRLDFPDSEAAKYIGTLLDVIFRRDAEFFQRLLEAVRWEHLAILEEDCFRMRRVRLLELGFPDPAEAAGLFAYLDPPRFDPAVKKKRSVESGPDGMEAPAFVLAPLGSSDLLTEALAGGVSSETGWELTYLVNKFMVAEGIDVGDMTQVREAMAEVGRYLNLGLEQYSGPDVKRAAALLEDVYLEHLFRVGYSMTLSLRERARAIRSSPIGPYLDGPFRSLVLVLDLKKPRLFRGIEARELGGDRPFGSLRDLRLAEEWLDRLEVQRRLMVDRLPFNLPEPDALELSGCFPDDPTEVRLADFFLTALANQVLGRPFVPKPIRREELPTLHAHICKDGRLAQNLRDETVRWADSLEPGGGQYAGFCLDLWEEGFCPVPPDRLDIRFLSGLLVRLS